ncbi:MAG: DHH family phosphoesterase [Planctomycetota bacterium]|jgi:phosphoesterase RecJ-like protein|nr:DHH family phosphoesterase [Planctomycetota bacterium]
MALTGILSLLRSPGLSRVALSGHERPDGDSLGACLGLIEIFHSLGRPARLVNPGPIPEKYRFLLRPGCLAEHGEPGWWREYDLFGALDCEAGRLPEANREAANRLPVFNIDHHVSNPGFGRAFWVEPAASSTSEMLVRLIGAAGWELTREAAQALWTGIVTDTGRFSQENATAGALEAARICLLAGADPVLSEVKVNQSASLGERRLQGRALERLRLLAGGRLAASWVEPADFRAAGLPGDVSYDLINCLGGIAGVEAWVLFTDPGPAAPGIKVSLRTLAPHDAVRLVRRFGGGGHRRAAGCQILDGLAAARDRFIAAALEEFFPPDGHGDGGIPPP